MADNFIMRVRLTLYNCRKFFRQSAAPASGFLLFELVDEIDQIVEPSLGAGADDGAGHTDAQMRLACACPAYEDSVALGVQEGAGGQFADVAESAPVIPRAVLMPAADGQILPATVATTGITDHDVVTAIGQQLHLGYRRIGGIEDADRGFRHRRRRTT